MTREQRSRLVARAQAVGVAMIAAASTPSILAGEASTAFLITVAGIATYYAGGYMGAIGTAPLE
jgi:formate dehydrogenase assembly factor FdhD